MFNRIPAQSFCSDLPETLSILVQESEKFLYEFREFVEQTGLHPLQVCFPCLKQMRKQLGISTTDIYN
jgi:hypothetical protein